MNYTPIETATIEKIVSIDESLLPGFTPVEQIMIKAVKEFWARTESARSN